MFVPGYKLYRLDCATLNPTTNRLKIGGGLAIKSQYESDSHCYKQFNVSNPDIEIQWFEFKANNIKPIIIINVHRPPSGIFNNFLDTTNIQLEKSNLTVSSEIFLLGDMNIYMLNTKDRLVTTFKNKINRHSLKLVIKEPTRYDQGKGTLIDLVFSNSTHILNGGTGSWNLSDHKLIFITRKLISKTKLKTTFIGLHT